MNLLSIFKQKSTTRASFIINTLGMGVAIAALYILAVQVRHDLGYNRGLKDYKNIYVATMVGSAQDGKKYGLQMPRPLAEQIIREVPEIAAGGAANLYITPTNYILLPDGSHGSADAGFERSVVIGTSYLTKESAQIFGFEFVVGSYNDIAGKPNHYAISESEARRLGLQVGDALMLNERDNKEVCQIAAIYKDMPRNSNFDLIKMIYDKGDAHIDNWNYWQCTYYMKLSTGVTVAEAEQAVRERMRRGCIEGGMFPAYYGINPNDEEEVQSVVEEFGFHFVPIADTYFDETLSSLPAYGSKKQAYTFLALAVLILLVAIINYVNMSFALVPVKIRSVNMRKILGSSRTSLTLSIVAEAVTMTIVAIGVAVVIIAAFQQSSFNGLLACTTSMAVNADILITCSLVAILVAIITSIYPALYLTSFEPAFALKANFGASATGRSLRYVLVMVQFATAIILIISSVVIRQQNLYLLNHDMGFDRENIIVAHTNAASANSNESIEAALRQNPQIKDVTWSADPIVRDYTDALQRVVNGESVPFDVVVCSPHLPEFLGIEITEGRTFSEADKEVPGGVFIFNETARQRAQFTLTSKFDGYEGYPQEIVGFFKDFNFKPLNSGISPMCFYMWWSPRLPMSLLYVRTIEGANYKDVMSFIEKTVNGFAPDLTAEQMDIHLFDRELQQFYQEVEDRARLIGMLAVMTIIISLLGVFGLVLFETEYRRKEIGVRRVNGASILDILKMFNRRYAAIVLTCFALAAPVSYLMMHSYLQDFAYRTPIHWWVFAIALIIVLILTVFIVTLRSLRAATCNPVESLRSE